MTTAAQRPIKARYHRKLFHPEPPSGQDIVALFKGREVELATSLAMLDENLDTRSRYEQDNPSDTDDFFGTDPTKHPWIVHGPTRSGKSHLGRRILEAFKGKDRCHALFFPCRERLEPTDIVREVFQQICDLFRELTAEAEAEPDIKKDKHFRHLVNETNALIQEVDRFGGPNPPEIIALEYHQEHLETLRSEFRAGFPAVIQFRLQGGIQSGTGGGRTATFRMPSAKQYSQYCGFVIDTLLRVGLLDHLLILVDDADLLENEYKSSQDARLKTVHLADALVDLHQWRGVDLLITARSHYAISKKEFYELIDLNGYSMKPADLIAIYRAHMEKFGWTDHREGFLTEEALGKAAEWAGRLPGVFLGHLSIARDAFKKEDSWDARTVDWYLSAFREFYNAYRNEYEAPARLLEDAVRKEQREISFPQNSPYPFYGKKYDNIFVIQSYYADTTCKIAPIVFEILGAR